MHFAGDSLLGSQAQYLHSSCSTPLLRRFLASLTGAASREKVDLSQPVALNLLCCTPGLCQPAERVGWQGMEYEHGPRALEGTQAPQVASVNPPSNNLLYNILLSQHLRVSDQYQNFCQNFSQNCILPTKYSSCEFSCHILWEPRKWPAAVRALAAPVAQQPLPRLRAISPSCLLRWSPFHWYLGLQRP